MDLNLQSELPTLRLQSGSSKQQPFVSVMIRHAMIQLCADDVMEAGVYLTPEEAIETAADLLLLAKIARGEDLTEN